MYPNYFDNIFAKSQFAGDNFFLIAGPCVVENQAICTAIAEKITQLSQALNIPYIFKASYKKANRTSKNSFTGIGDEKGLEIIQTIGKQFEIPTVTDVHSVEECFLAAKYVDILQIPAFLCRQTELLIAAGETGKIVNIKKGQFLSGAAMAFAAEKIRQTNNEKIMLTERGNSFGYQDLVVDFRNIPWMKKIGYPVVMDVTHSLQQPNQNSGITGGNPALIETIAAAAIATGADGLFIETHPNPAQALSDGANMLPLDLLESLLKKLVKIKAAIS